MMNDSSETYPLDNFKDYYLVNICPYINFPACVIGSFLNVLNIAVFSRKSMDSLMSMSTIFLHLSIVELAALLVNIPLTWHVCVLHKDVHQHVHNWEIFHIFGRCTVLQLYYTSIWLTVMLTIWRYKAIAHPFDDRSWGSKKNTRMMLIAGYMFGIVLSLPSWFSLHIEERKENQYRPTIEFYEEGVLFYIHFILYGTVLKLVPSVILTVFSYKLIKALSAIKSKRVSMSQNNFTAVQKIANIKQQTDFTTRMLFGILVAFLISEVPSGILGLCSIIRGKEFRKHYFSATIHTFNSIRLISISISFLVYYNLSQQFRTTFKAMFNKHNNYRVTNTSTKESRSSDF